MNARSVVAAAAVVALVGFASPGAHANLLANGGFETGDFTGWTLSGNDGFTGVSCGTFDGYTAYSGSCFAYLGAVGSPADLSQTITTVAGASYDITFELASDGGIPNEFAVDWDGTPLMDVVNSSAFPYTEFAIPVTGTGSDTLLISAQDNPGYWALDAVSVDPTSDAVPEPATLSLFGAALAGLGILRRRRQQS